MLFLIDNVRRFLNHATYLRPKIVNFNTKVNIYLNCYDGAIVAPGNLHVAIGCFATDEFIFYGILNTGRVF